MNVLKKIIFVLAISTIAISVQAQLSFGAPQKINYGWRFYLGEIDNAHAIEFNDNNWQIVNLPHDWSVAQPYSPTYASCMGYLPGGIGWYRKIIDIPREQQNNQVYLYFEGVYNRSTVYINGKLVGERPNGYVSFAYDITSFVNFGTKNTISVRVDHSKDADSRWYTGSGVYRDAWLVYASPIHIAQWGVYAYSEIKSNKNALLHIETEVENNADENANITIVNELFDESNKSIAKQTTKTSIKGKSNTTLKQKLNIKNPILWNLENPTLYSLNTKVYTNGKLIDENTLKTGIRSFTFDPKKGMALNGKWIKAKGVCIHHDSGVLGAASYKDVWKRRLNTLKEIGVNAIRTSHNPQATHLYELCDELGVLVIDELYDEWKYPKRKWLDGWNMGTPGYEGSYDYFEEWGEKDLEDIIRRDRNHVSIFAWSIGNEVDYPNDPYSHPILSTGGGEDFTQPLLGGYKKEAPDATELGVIAKKLATAVRKYDTSRPITAGLAGVSMSNSTDYPFVLDIAGYNYTESRYKTDHEKYPDRVIYGSENRHELEAWLSVVNNEHIFGQFLWTGIDYLGESGQWPSRGFYSGLVDFGGFIKPRGYFRQTLWSDKPTIYIGTYPTPGEDSGSGMKDVWSQLQNQSIKRKEEKPSMDAWPIWNYETGESIRVVCYSNAPYMQLYLNGKAITKKKAYDNELGIVYWDIPYQEGKLEALGFDKSDKEVVRTFIQSSGRPYKLIVTNQNPVISKNQGIAHVVVTVVDEDNIPVLLADNEIKCMIDGDATLLGLEASNNEDMSDYSDNIHRVFNGQILAYIQANGSEDTVKVKFTSSLLKSAETEIVIK